MQASLEPVVEHPVASEPPRACHSSARMLTQRDSSSAVCGYSSLSIMFLPRRSAMSTSACGSIQVVTKVARLRRGLPSRISSSRTTCSAVAGKHAPARHRVPGHVVAGLLHIDRVDVHIGLARLIDFPVQGHGVLQRDQG
jgi:hypothetical protein